MAESPTPGQIAYEHWWMAFGDDPPLADAYAQLTPRAQAAWEAAAEAVRAMQKEETSRCMHFGHTMHATQGLCGVASPWVALLPRLVTCQACIALMQSHDRKEVPHG